MSFEATWLNCKHICFSDEIAVKTQRSQPNGRITMCLVKLNINEAVGGQAKHPEQQLIFTRHKGKGSFFFQ